MWKTLQRQVWSSAQVTVCMALFIVSAWVYVVFSGFLSLSKHMLVGELAVLICPLVCPVLCDGLMSHSGWITALECSWDMLWLHHDPVQDKLLTEDEYMNENEWTASVFERHWIGKLADQSGHADMISISCISYHNIWTIFHCTE